MDIPALKTILNRDEGLRLKPYLDTSGKWTIGVGRNLSDIGISAVEADFLLTNDIQKVQAQLNAALPWWVGLSNNRQMVIASMAFNLGISGLLGFRNMLAAVKAENFHQAAHEMETSKWASQVGDRATRLAKMMEFG